jgi:tight adherence protein B
VIAAGGTDVTLVATSAAMFVAVVGAVLAGAAPAGELLRRQERQFDRVLRGSLLLDVAPRSASLMSALAIVFLAGTLFVMTGSWLGGAIGVGIGLVLPSLAMRYLRKRRLNRLEDQLVGGIQTLASGVRAGLNLVQAMELVARDGPIPLRQEFAHLLREYEYGMSLEEAMDTAAARIGSGDFRLLFAALQTHRERGGNLGETLDRIAASIREIQRLEGRIKALTAQGRATARWLGAMPVVVLAVLYFFVDAEGVRTLFADGIGKAIILAIVALNVVGFLWVRKIVSVDV